MRTPKKTFASQLPKYAVTGIVGLGVVVAISKALAPDENALPIQVMTANLSEVATTGKQLFGENCAACHGTNAAGSQNGPPLIHDIYNPGHHSDESFQIAVAQGVRQHHWPFGNMPKQPQVTKDQVAMIIKYVRELQEANGIGYRQHKM